jgi:hypothetical protein
MRALSSPAGSSILRCSCAFCVFCVLFTITPHTRTLSLPRAPRYRQDDGGQAPGAHQRHGLRNTQRRRRGAPGRRRRHTGGCRSHRAAAQHRGRLCWQGGRAAVRTERRRSREAGRAGETAGQAATCLLCSRRLVVLAAAWVGQLPVDPHCDRGGPHTNTHTHVRATAITFASSPPPPSSAAARHI